MQRYRKPEVGLTTTRRGEMTSPNVIRRRRQTPQQHRTTPASVSRSRHALPTAEFCPSTSLLERGSRTPYSEQQTTEERWVTAHRLSSTLPPPRRAELGIIDDQLCNTTVHHPQPYRHQSHQHQCYSRDHHHYQQQHIQQRQAVVTADNLRDGQYSTFSRASTMRSGDGTIASTSTGSQDYFTDCESEQSKHHQRQPQRRRRLPQPPTAIQRSSRPIRTRSSVFATGDDPECRGATSSQSKHRDIGFQQSVAARRSGGRTRSQKFQPRSRSCDGIRTVNNDDDDTFATFCSAGAARRAKYAGRPYAVQSGSSSRWLPTNFAVVDECSKPRRLAWKTLTPHGVLSLRSTSWSEISGTGNIGRSTSADAWRQPTDAQWLTIPRLSRRSSCDGGRPHTLPASFRLRCRSGGATATDERISLEPIGRGVESLECERCYLAATTHLYRSSGTGSRTTLPPLVIDSIEPEIEANGRRDSDELSRRERIRPLHNAIRKHQACQNCIKDYTAATLSNGPHQSTPTVDSLHNDRLSSFDHCHGTRIAIYLS